MGRKREHRSRRISGRRRRTTRVGDDGDGEAEEWGGERGEVVVVMEEEGVGVVEV